jgi:hypothetical protein
MDRNAMKYVAAMVLSLCLFLWAAVSSAGIYRYEDETGAVYFTNCPRDPKFKLYIRESKDDDPEEGNTQSFISGGISGIKGFNQYDPLIFEASRKFEVDFALIKAVIRAESGFNPTAISRKGAKGLMQLMPETASRMNVSNIFNPKENIEGGVRYLKYLLSLFDNDLRLSLAAYNAGENLVSELRSIPPYRETVDYVRKVMNYYQSYRP